MNIQNHSVNKLLKNHAFNSHHFESSNVHVLDESGPPPLKRNKFSNFNTNYGNGIHTRGTEIAQNIASKPYRSDNSSDFSFRGNASTPVFDYLRRNKEARNRPSEDIMGNERGLEDYGGPGPRWGDAPESNSSIGNDSVAPRRFRNDSLMNEVRGSASTFDDRASKASDRAVIDVDRMRHEREQLEKEIKDYEAKLQRLKELKEKTDLPESRKRSIEGDYIFNEGRRGDYASAGQEEMWSRRDLSPTHRQLSSRASRDWETGWVTSLDRSSREVPGRESSQTRRYSPTSPTRETSRERRSRETSRDRRSRETSRDRRSRQTSRDRTGRETSRDWRSRRTSRDRRSRETSRERSGRESARDIMQRARDYTGRRQRSPDIVCLDALPNSKYGGMY